MKLGSIGLHDDKAIMSNKEVAIISSSFFCVGRHCQDAFMLR
jgi:hypothetical protein